VVPEVEREHERGANLVEYVMLLTLVALAVVASVVFLRGQVAGRFGEAGSQLSNNGVATAPLPAATTPPPVVTSPPPPPPTPAPTTPTPPTTGRRHDDD